MILIGEAISCLDSPSHPIYIYIYIQSTTECSSLSTLAGLSFHICGKLEVAFKASPNLVPRSHSVTGNVRSGKVRFRACSVPARPEIRAFLSLRMFVLSVVILGV